MNAYVSTELSMIQMLDPRRHELALEVEAFLNKGGTIEVLQGPSFVPPPVRHEPPPSAKPSVRRAKPEPVGSNWCDKMALRDLEREERAAMREKEKADQLEYIRGLAAQLTYAQAVLRTGIPLRELNRVAKKGGFSFQPAHAKANKGGKILDEERDAKQAEMIIHCKALGFSRNKTRESIQASHKAFERLLEKFNIDYPKATKGPHPAFFPKNKEASQ